MEYNQLSLYKTFHIAPAINQYKFNDMDTFAYRRGT